ncbi:MAG: NusG domain II-containing protein [Zoogloeaceae bacterium]|jgi:hypothetical protein|nr:NusG domain II-containing protein [Zoogloeaceae bacterium]
MSAPRFAARIKGWAADWRRYALPGDMLCTALFALGVGVSFPWLWPDGAAERAVIRVNGTIFREVPLGEIRGSVTLEVPGALGATKIVLEKGRARVAEDPGPRQYCVRQGWLSRAGMIAICAPNRVSLSIVGKDSPYDSLNY